MPPFDRPCFNHSCIMLCCPYDLILTEALGKHPFGTGGSGDGLGKKRIKVTGQRSLKWRSLWHGDNKRLRWNCADTNTATVAKTEINCSRLLDSDYAEWKSDRGMKSSTDLQRSIWTTLYFHLFIDSSFSGIIQKMFCVTIDKRKTIKIDEFVIWRELG